MKFGGGARPVLFGVAALTCVGLLAPGSAPAAKVVNGDFETGTLAGWQVHRSLEAGNWFAYEIAEEPGAGSSEPISEKRGDGPIEEPPEGEFAAVADEIDPDTLILSQDIGLGAGLSHRLNLLAYYESYVPIAVPALDTLSSDSEVLGGQANQQYRIDVMKPTAPIESVDPADILTTVFRTQPGDPRFMDPTRLTANLSPFAGQTVRLRIAVAAHEEVLIGGVDAVAVESAPPGQLPPLGKKPGDGGSGGSRADLFSFGRAKANPRNGTAVLPVRVSGPGLLKADAQGAPVATAGAAHAKKPAKLIKPTRARARAKGTVKLLLKPTPAALAILKEKHKLRIKVAVTFEPQGGKPETATVPVVLKLEAPPKHR
jgi:hypothetical protein